ncbi:MAG: hypothetical protein JWN84_810 [Nocardioides sp.]|nr:hypothetical protein [Nocardioides sp.]
MATLHVTSTTVRVELTRTEKVLGLLRDIEVPLGSVTSARIVDSRGAVQGIRSPGLAVPRRRKIGTWRSRGRRTAVSVRAGEPTLRLTLDGAAYDEVVVSSPEAPAWLGQLRLHGVDA